MTPMELYNQDERLHQPKPQAGWQESYYFNFHAPSHSGAVRIGLRPQSGIERMALLMSKDRTLAHIQREPRGFDFSVLEQGALSFHLLAPFKKWRLRAQADFVVIRPEQEILSAFTSKQKTTTRVTFDLSFNAQTPAYLFPKHAFDFVGRNQRHFEQAGQLEGTLCIDSQETSFSGVGVRDHSWGVRDWLGAEEWYWINLTDKTEPLFASATYGRVQDASFVEGFVWQGSSLQPVQRLEIETRHGDDLSLIAGQVHLATEDEQFDVTLIPQQSAHICVSQTDRWRARVSENAVTYRHRGRQNALGWFSHGRRDPV